MSSALLFRLRVGAARSKQMIGWAGIAGIVVLVAAASWTARAWGAHRAFIKAYLSEASASLSRFPAPVPAVSPQVEEHNELPTLADVPLLLTQMKQAVVSSGLEWRAADYRIVAETSNQPSSLEVRCTIKGTYPKLRAALVEIKSTVPAFALRDFNAARPNADTPEIEAKLVMAVILSEATVPSSAESPRPR